MTNWTDKEIAITGTLDLIMKQSTQEEREHIGRLLLLLLEGFELGWQEEEVRQERPADTARRLHKAVELRLAETRQDPTAEQITCRRGCAHCCHMNVSVMPQEADLLVEVAMAKGISINLDRLFKQVPWKEDEDWMKQSRVDTKCVFLGDNNECRVYEDRPLACRKYFVVSEPELCNIEKNPRKLVGIWHDTQLEIIATAAWTFYGADTLPRQLMKAMARRAGLRKEAL